MFDRIVQRVFDKRASKDEVLVTIPNHPLTRGTLSCLRARMWLKDDVLDTYMALLQERAVESCRSKFLPTHFYQVISTVEYSVRSGLPYVKEQDLFEWDYLFIPITVAAIHWVMVLVDLQGRAIFALDPLPKPDCTLNREMEVVSRFLNDLAITRKAAVAVPSWRKMKLEGLPIKVDTYNCGVYVLLYAELISRQADIIIDPLTLPYMRKRIVVDLVSKQISRQ